MTYTLLLKPLVRYWVLLIFKMAAVCRIGCVVYACFGQTTKSTTVLGVGGLYRRANSDWSRQCSFEDRWVEISLALGLKIRIHDHYHHLFAIRSMIYKTLKHKIWRVLRQNGEIYICTVISLYKGNNLRAMDQKAKNSVLRHSQKRKNRKSNISPGCRVKFHVISLNGFTGYAYKVLTSQHLTFFVDLVYVNLTIV